MNPSREAVAEPQRTLKHVKVREFVRGLVADADPGDLAPSERELVERFGVARMTVRQALDALVSEGLLERVPGRGTFVADRRRGFAAGGQMLSFSEDMARRGLSPSYRTLLARIEPAGAGVSRALECESGTPTTRWQRLQLADGAPMCLQDVWVLERTAPGLVRETDQGRGFFDLLRSHGVTPTWGEDAVEAAVAGTEEAHVLGLADHAPVLRVSRMVYSDDGPIAAMRSTFRADRYSLRSKVTRGGVPEPRRP